MTPALFPMFVKLAGRTCLVVGAGSVAAGKIAGLLASGARVRVVAPSATRRVAELARGGRIDWTRRAFRADDLRGAFLVVAATSSRRVHVRVYRAAVRRGVLCNVVDEPARCDFYYPAVVRRGPLQIAISTGGRSPALARRLRQELERQFGREYGPWVERLGRARQQVLGSSSDSRLRRRLLHRLASRAAFRRFLARSRTRRSRAR